LEKSKVKRGLMNQSQITNYPPSIASSLMDLLFTQFTIKLDRCEEKPSTIQSKAKSKNPKQ
jgi:hypothetical protein